MNLAPSSPVVNPELFIGNLQDWLFTFETLQARAHEKPAEFSRDEVLLMKQELIRAGIHLLMTFRAEMNSPPAEGDILPDETNAAGRASVLCGRITERLVVLESEIRVPVNELLDCLMEDVVQPDPGTLT